MDVYICLLFGIVTTGFAVVIYISVPFLVGIFHFCSVVISRQKTTPASRECDLPLPCVSRFNFIRQFTELKSIFGPNAHEVLMETCRQNGPIYKFGFPGAELVFVFDYEDICHLKEAEGKFPVHIDFKHLRLYREAKGYPPGLLICNGQEWQEQRNVYGKMLVGAISQAKYTPVINAVAIAAVRTIKRETFQPMELIENYVTEAFCRALYGIPLGCLSDQPVEKVMMKKFIQVTKSNFSDAKKLLVIPTCILKILPIWRKHNQRWDFLLKTTMGNIERSEDEAYHHGKETSIFTDLLNSGKVKNDELQVNLTDFTLASIDTTATTLIWCLYTIGSHPKVQEDIVQEIQSHINCTMDITNAELHNLHYLKAVLKETLRLYPIANFTSRVTSEPVTIRGYRVPAETHLAMSMYVMGHNSDLFPEPEKFDPGRWLKGNEVYSRFYHDVPFGFGPRMCLGRKLAEKEVMLFLVHFCLTFQFKVENSSIEPVTKLFMVPSEPIELKLQRRCV